MHETHDLPAQDPRGPLAADPRGDRAAARQGGVSGTRDSAARSGRASATACACGSPASRARCATTASRSGLPRRATRSRSSPRRPPRGRRRCKPALRALFCATHSDWERFDEIFDAFWRGRGMRSAQTLRGAPAESRAPLRRIAEAGGIARAAGRCPITSSGARAEAERQRRARPARGRVARGERSPRPTCATSSIPDDIARDARARRAACAHACGRGWCAASRCAGAGGGSICAAPSIATSRHGGTPIDLVWRTPQGQAAAPGRAARRVRLDETSTPRSSCASCTAWSMPSARPRRSSSTPGSRMSRRRCATAT